MAKDAAILQRGPVKEPVNYAPYECNENNGILSKAERKELIEQHKRFKIFPSGGEEGQIYDYVRHIPYNSEKKTFFGKTGREGFERESHLRLELEQALLTMIKCSNMSSICPMTQTGSMWSCGITKMDLSASRLSSNHSTIPRYVLVLKCVFRPTDTQQTTPNKVLGANHGLRELSHSITGGSIAAQGYWMPYGCARAVCATFCWNIRWALTPIFGPSFLKDCLPPYSPNYSRFKIDPEVIRVSQRECEGWRDGIAREYTPMSGMSAALPPTNTTSQPALPIAAARAPIALSPKMLRPRRSTQNKTVGSPFNTDSDEEYQESTTDPLSRYSRYNDSPSVSPKTIVTPPPVWTSVNNHSGRGRPYSNTDKSSPRTSEESFMPATPTINTLRGFQLGFYAPPTSAGLGKIFYDNQGPTPTPPFRSREMPPPDTPQRQLLQQFQSQRMSTMETPIAHNCLEPKPLMKSPPTSTVSKRRANAVIDEQDRDEEGKSTDSDEMSTTAVISGSTGRNKRARIEVSGVGRFRAREFNAARTLLQMAAEDADLGEKRRLAELRATTCTNGALEWGEEDTENKAKDSAEMRELRERQHEERVLRGMRMRRQALLLQEGDQEMKMTATATATPGGCVPQMSALQPLGGQKRRITG